MKTITILNSMKSGYFMLVACVTLLLGATACNDEEFGSEALEVEKELALEERIEQILSQYPRTRANFSTPVVMKTKIKNVHIQCFATEDVIVYWDSLDFTYIPKNTYDDYFFTFPNGEEERVIFLEVSNQAIQQLNVCCNDLTFLNVKNNINLEILSCDCNFLSDLRLTGCPNLKVVNAITNNLSTLDVSHLTYLETLNLSMNELTAIDVSKNLNLQTLAIDSNPIKNLDISKNTQLQILLAGDTYITNLDLTNSTCLKELYLFYLSDLQTINNDHINSNSFSTFVELKVLDIQYTSFNALNLPNDSLRYLDISGTPIKYLDISRLQIDYLNTTNSSLTTFEYTENSLFYAYYISVAGTPFEKYEFNLDYLITDAIPNRYNASRDGKIINGRFITTLDLSVYERSYLKKRNWEVANH